VGEVGVWTKALQQRVVVKVRKNEGTKNRAEVENSFLKRKQRAGSEVDGKKQRQKYISRGNPSQC
jgi:hypothetical protein